MAFLEEYTLLDELGRGGYATVYKVRHNKLGYIRAIRALNAVIAHGEEDKTYQKFLEECKLLLRLGNGNHPNIVHIYRPFLREGHAIVEMDYVDGADLSHYLEKSSSFVEIEDVLKLLSDISSALAYCHEDIYKFCMNKDEDSLKDDPNDGSKLLIDDKIRQRRSKKYQGVHNDIHSGNIIRREDGNYVLLDFGLAIDGDSVVRSSRRKNGAPEFKAPEKWDNDSILTTQSDIYSFLSCMNSLLAGCLLFSISRPLILLRRNIY
ncbi:MAG: protein kinase [Odoribacter sp.]|nr:protein kinase [Odoribacter sp.]